MFILINKSLTVTCNATMLNKTIASFFANFSFRPTDGWTETYISDLYAQQSFSSKVETFFNISPSIC